MVVTGIKASRVDYQFDVSGCFRILRIAVDIARNNSQRRFDLAIPTHSCERVCNRGRDPLFLRIELQMNRGCRRVSRQQQYCDEYSRNANARTDTHVLSSIATPATSARPPHLIGMNGVE